MDISVYNRLGESKILLFLKIRIWQALVKETHQKNGKKEKKKEGRERGRKEARKQGKESGKKGNKNYRQSLHTDSTYTKYLHIYSITGPWPQVSMVFLLPLRHSKNMSISLLSQGTLPSTGFFSYYDHTSYTISSIAFSATSSRTFSFPPHTFPLYLGSCLFFFPLWYLKQSKTILLTYWHIVYDQSLHYNASSLRASMLSVIVHPITLTARAVSSVGTSDRMND